MTQTKIVRRRRLRQAAGLAGAGVVAATAAAVAIPTLAQSDENAAAQVAETPATQTIAATTSAPAALTAEQEALKKLQNATPEERQAFVQMFWTPEQRFAFALYVATPEQREAFVQMFQTPAPIAAPTVSPKARPAANRGGGAPGGFLACVRNRESRGQYSAYNPSGASGAYQMMPQTARNTALHAGRPDLAGRPVSSWSPADQDAMAAHLYSWQGAAPWGGGC
jgi:hypothetical protein